MIIPANTKPKTKANGWRAFACRKRNRPQWSSTAGSTCRGLLPGYRFRLQDHYRRDFNKTYVLTTVLSLGWIRAKVIAVAKAK